MTSDKWSHADEFGVRYSFGKSFIGKWVVPAALWAIPGVGPALATAYGAINNYQNDSSFKGAAMGGLQGISAGVGAQGIGGAISGAMKGGTAAAPGFLSKGAGIASGAVKGLTAGTNSALNRLPGISGLNESTGIAAKGSSLSNFGVDSLSSAGKSNIAGLTSDFAPVSSGGGAMSQGFNASMGSSPSMNLLGNAGAINSALKAFNPTQSNAGINSSSSLPTKTDILSQTAPKQTMSPMSKFGVGSAITAAGQFLGPQTPEVPTSRFATMMEQGGLQPRTAIGQQAMAKASELLAQNPQGLSEEYKNAIMADFDKQDEAEQRVLLQNYKSLRPYADIENDSAYNKDLTDLKQEQQEYRKNTLAKLEQANEESNKTFQRQDIMNAMGIDEQTFNEYASLANQDLNTIMMQTGIDYGQAQQFKDMFGKLGGMFISSGLGTDKSSLSDFVVKNGGIMN
jgi:hypothetical protein